MNQITDEVLERLVNQLVEAKTTLAKKEQEGKISRVIVNAHLKRLLRQAEKMGASPELIKEIEKTTRLLMRR
ncbi:MAG: hypothetical protein H0U60_02510 [Blastocatellia bacterium]|nr:hypothetical protein [Blastocatellia bacterium]